MEGNSSESLPRTVVLQLGEDKEEQEDFKQLRPAGTAY